MSHTIALAAADQGIQGFGPMNNEPPSPKKTENKFVNAETLLEMLFSKPCRPSIHWLWNQTKAGTIPCTKVGRLVFFDPEKVKEAINNPRSKQ